MLLKTAPRQSCSWAECPKNLIVNLTGEVTCGGNLKRSRINITPAHEADHVTMGISLIMSTRGVGLLPAYAQNFLPASVTSRPLKGEAPTVELVLGYKKSNQSPILKLLLSRVDECRSCVE
jgi:DNA-binding transcriptional LysR family regulator